jgi:hypothetical protein
VSGARDPRKDHATIMSHRSPSRQTVPA